MKRPLIYGEIVVLPISGKNKEKANGSIDNALAENGKQSEEIGAVPEYKLPLVWIDLEMTGRIRCLSRYVLP